MGSLGSKSAVPQVSEAVASRDVLVQTFTDAPPAETVVEHVFRKMPRNYFTVVLRYIVDFFASIKEPARRSQLHRFVYSQQFKGVSMFVIFVNAILTSIVFDLELQSV